MAWATKKYKGYHNIFEGYSIDLLRWPWGTHLVGSRLWVIQLRLRQFEGMAIRFRRVRQFIFQFMTSLK